MVVVSFEHKPSILYLLVIASKALYHVQSRVIYLSLVNFISKLSSDIPVHIIANQSSITRDTRCVDELGIKPRFTDQSVLAQQESVLLSCIQIHLGWGDLCEGVHVVFVKEHTYFLGFVAPREGVPWCCWLNVAIISEMVYVSGVIVKAFSSRSPFAKDLTQKMAPLYGLWTW